MSHVQIRTRLGTVIAIMLAVPLVALAQTAYTIAPPPFLTALDNAGRVINNACIWVYAAGTTTTVTTYQDAAGASPNTNPIRSDSAGRFTAYLVPGAGYKFVFEAACTPPAHGTTLRTADNISGMPSSSASVDVTAVAGETVTAGAVVYLSDGSGGKTAGQWYMADADLAYASISAPLVGLAASAITATQSGTVRVSGRQAGLTGLTTGTDYFVSATAGALSATTGIRYVGRADSTTSLVVSQAQLSTPSVDVPITVGETVAAGNAVYLSDGTGSRTAGQWYLADADFVYMSTEAPIVGVVLGAVTNGNAGVARLWGPVTGLSSLTTGASYYASATAGALTSTAPTAARFIARALTTTSIWVSGGAPATSTLGGVLTRPELKNYTESSSSPSISSGTLTLDFANGNHFGVSLNANITTLSFSNVPATGKAAAAVIRFTADGTLRTITWPAAVKWPGAVAPTMTSTNGKVDIVTLYTVDGGTNWFASLAGQNF